MPNSKGKKLNAGDILGVKGDVFKTIRRDKHKSKEYSLLAKAIRTLPDNGTAFKTLRCGTGKGISI